jgi:hypothetical protein
MENQSYYESLKRDAIDRLWKLEDPIRLHQILDLLKEGEPTPQYILDLIDQGLAESKAGLGTPIEDFLKEIESL